MLETYKHMGNWSIEGDRDFDKIRADSKYGERFLEIVHKINQSTQRGTNPVGS
jgi:hypothetical protein